MTPEPQPFRDLAVEAVGVLLGAVTLLLLVPLGVLGALVASDGAGNVLAVVGLSILVLSGLVLGPLLVASAVMLGRRHASAGRVATIAAIHSGLHHGFATLGLVVAAIRQAASASELGRDASSTFDAVGTPLGFAIVIFLVGVGHAAALGWVARSRRAA